MDFGHKEWIERVRDLAHSYKCWRGYNDEVEIRKLEGEKKSEERKRLSFAIGRINDEIKLLKTVMREHEDISRALYDYASILERLVECRTRMIPHKRDTEIIDYIVKGARYDDTTK